MWLIHIVAVPGSAGWQQGLALWLIVLTAGWGFAQLTGESATPDALLVDIALAGIGGLLLNLLVAPFGQDPLALVFGLRLFWTALGAVLLLLLVHDAVHLLWRRLPPKTIRRLVISNRGGFILLLIWLSGWPSEAALVEVTYERGLAIKLMGESLHYQVRVGPLLGARAVPLLPGIRTIASDASMVVEALPGTPAASVLRFAVTFEHVTPDGAARALSERIAALAAARDS